MTETLSAILPDGLEGDVHRLLETACKRKLSLATAESCTGGLLASILTDVEGQSHAFERGFVVYTDQAKHELLGVPTDLLEREGAVSQAVALAMAEGALQRSGADITLSVTGFAGPAGEGDETGLVHFACARRDRETRHREEHFGDIGRGATRIACVEAAVAMLAEAING